MKSNIFLAALPSHDNRMTLTQKIHACEAKRSPLIKLQWATMQDLHVTLGYITDVLEKDLRTIALGFAPVAQTRPFMATVEDVRLYGNAIVLKVEPYQALLQINKKMNQRVIEASSGTYQFESNNRFDPHLTVAKIRNLRDLNPLHKNQLINLIQEQFRGYAFLIQQIGLLRRQPDSTTHVYQAIQLYTLQG